ncbi:MAG: hypothetical protein Q7U28_15035 [Aquabacterium sp.]|nr:hypothetical protein [Aquabacterium sp.]
MKNLAMTALAAALAFGSPAFAEDAHHPEIAASAAKTAPAKPAVKNPAQTVQQMQDNVKKMQPQLDRIAKAKTDEERQKAMAEHMTTMQENMMMARGMQADTMGCPMMDDMGKGMMGKGGGMGMMMGGSKAEGAPDHMQQMEKRMDMMQDMMKMMMDRMPAPVAK